MGAVKKDVLLILNIICITQVGEVLWVQVPVSIRRVWAQSLKRATLQITSRGGPRSMYLGRVYGKRVTRVLLVGKVRFMAVPAKQNKHFQTKTKKRMQKKEGVVLRP